MSQPIVQQSSPVNFGGTNATAQATLTSVTAGNRLMVFAFGWGGTAYPAFTASDGTNDYVQVNANSGDPNGGRISATILYREDVEAGSHTVTVTHAATSGNRYGWFVLVEVSGGEATGGLISACTAKIETGTTTYTNPSITAADVPGVAATAFAVLMANAQNTDAGIDAATGTPASWTNVFVEQDNYAEAAGSADIGAVGASDTAVCDWGTISAASRCAAVIVVFQDAAAAPSATYDAWVNPRRNRPGRGPYSKGRYFRKAVFQPYVAATSIASVTWTASGGITLSGASGVLRGVARAASGGLVLGGSALLSRGVVRTPSGGLVLGGTAPAARGAARLASGGFALGGTAPQTRGAVRDPSGGISLGGSAGYSSSSGAQSYSYVASGGLVLGGTADVEFVSLQSFSYTGVGGVEIAGTAPVYFTRVVLPTGGLSLGGSADFSSHSASRVVVASGGLRLRGAAVVTTFGGLSVAGDYVIRARRRRRR